MADRLRLIGAVDSIDRIAEIERAGAERVARTSRHETWQVGLARNHFGRRCPVGPLCLAGYLQQTDPLKAFTPDADPITQRPVVALDDVQEALRSCDDDRAGRLDTAKVHELPLVGGWQVLFIGRGLIAGLLLDGQLL